jgi:hypothetical protein
MILSKSQEEESATDDEGKKQVDESIGTCDERQQGYLYVLRVRCWSMPEGRRHLVRGTGQVRIRLQCLRHIRERMSSRSDYEILRYRMPETSYDVVISGCGPVAAGAATAISKNGGSAATRQWQLPRMLAVNGFPDWPFGWDCFFLTLTRKRLTSLPNVRYKTTVQTFCMRGRKAGPPAKATE